MSEHAKLSPSSAKRWMLCPGSVSLASTVVDAGGADADQGTACHKMLEKYLKEAVEPKSWRGKHVLVVNEELTTTNEVPVTDEMIEWVEHAIGWVRSYLDEHHGAHPHLMSEERVHVGRAFGCPDEIWGTSDIVISTDEELVIADLKAGYGEVEAFGNPQLLLYAIGAMQEYGWVHPQVRLVILQPRVGDGVKEAVYTAAEVEDARKRYAPKVKAALSVDAPLVPAEDACRWCPAAGVCPALHERTLALAKHEFSVETRSLTKEQVSFILGHRERIRAALNAVERHATKLLLSGVKLPGWKLVLSDKRRVWKDEKAAVQVLASLGYRREDYLTMSLVSPAQAEKLVGKKTAPKLSPLIEKPKGEPTIAEEGDPREPVAPEFEAVDDDDEESLL